MCKILEIEPLGEFKENCVYLRDPGWKKGLEKLQVAFEPKIYHFAFFLCINVGYNNTVESQIATTFPEPPIFQNNQSFQVKSLYLDPVVSSQLIDNTCRAEIDNVVLQHYCIPTKFKR